MLKVTTVLALAVLVLAAPAVLPFAQGKNVDEEPLFLEVWKDYVVAKKRFQVNLNKLMTDKWPDLKSIASLHRDQQLAMIELRDIKFKYLVEYDPARIVLDKGLSAFSNFDWTESDSDKLRAINPEFGKLESWIDETNKKISEHPNKTGIHERILELMKDEAYNSTIARFNKRLDQLETALEVAAREVRED